MKRVRYQGRWFWGMLFLILGGLLLLHNLNYIDIKRFLADYWPLLLIFIGLWILAHRGHYFGSEKPPTEYPESKTSLNVSHIFGDLRLKIDDKDFNGGMVDNVFGNIEIDLEEVRLKEGNSKLYLNGVFGDQNIIIPKNLPISIEASTSFGTVRIKDRSSSDFTGHLHWSTSDFAEASSRLNIQVKQVFGDIRVF
jgi:predicted membrane protein